VQKHPLPTLAYGIALILAAYVCLFAVGGNLRALPMMILASVGCIAAVGIGAGMAGAVRHQWPVPILVGLCLTGVILTGVIIAVMADTSQEGPLLDRVCRPDGQFNRCQQAFQSRWANIPLGRGENPPKISSVVLGMGFYSTLLIWFVIVGRPSHTQRRQHCIPLLLTLAGAAIAGVLMYVMLTRLAYTCNLCVASHAVTGALLLVTALAWPRQSLGAETTEPFESPTWHRPVTALFVAVLLFFCFSQVRMNQTLQQSSAQFSAAYQQLTDDADYIRWDFERQPVQKISLQADDSVIGPAGAPWLLITYGDFQCPQCKALMHRIEEVAKEYPHRLRVVFRHFPLDRSCNSRTTTYMHAFSCQAALAAEAARRVGGDKAFWKMHDALFASQSILDERPYARLAAQIGLDVGRFEAEIAHPATGQRIQTQIEGSAAYAVSSTPAVFLNGRRLRQWDNLRFWRAIFEGTPGTPTTTPLSTSRP